MSIGVSADEPLKLKETGFYVDLFLNSKCTGRSFSIYFSEAFCEPAGASSRLYYFDTNDKIAKVKRFEQSSSCEGNSIDEIILPIGKCSHYRNNYFGISSKTIE